MLPGAGLAIRLRPGLCRRRSWACAAAQPGPPAGYRTWCYRFRWRSRALSAAAGGAGPTARRRPPVSRRQGRTGRSAIAGRRVLASRRQPRPPGQARVRQARAAGPVCAGWSFPPRPGSALRCQGPRRPARSLRRMPMLPGPAAGGRRPSARPRRRRGSGQGRQRTPSRVSLRAWSRRGRRGPTAAAAGPCCNHEPSRHCRPGGGNAPGSQAATCCDRPPAKGLTGAGAEARQGQAERVRPHFLPRSTGGRYLPGRYGHGFQERRDDRPVGWSCRGSAVTAGRSVGWSLSGDR
jgi:hypothetical protein